jgi:hypothetical protein
LEVYLERWIYLLSFKSIIKSEGNCDPVTDMEFSNWPVEELEALARVYLKHKQLHRAQALRVELASRLQTNESDSVRQLFEQLDDTKVVSLTDRIFGRKKFA